MSAKFYLSLNLIYLEVPRIEGGYLGEPFYKPQ
jgi:hypothetical protein